MINLRGLSDRSLVVLEAILEEFYRVEKLVEEQQGIIEDDLMDRHLDSEESLFEFLKAHEEGAVNYRENYPPK